MRMHSAVFLSALFSLTLAPGAVFGAGPNLGKPISPADLAPWDIDTEPERGGVARGQRHVRSGCRDFCR